MIKWANIRRENSACGALGQIFHQRGFQKGKSKIFI